MLAIICKEPISSEQRAYIDSILEEHLMQYEKELLYPADWNEQHALEQEVCTPFHRPYLHEMNESTELHLEKECVHIGEIELWQRIDYFMEYYEGVKGWTL